MFTLAAVAVGLQAANGLLSWYYKRRGDKALAELETQKAVNADLMRKATDLETGLRVAQEEVKKVVAKAAQDVADAALRTNEVGSNLKAEIAKLEKDLATCTTPDALRARLNNLNGLLQGT